MNRALAPLLAVARRVGGLLLGGLSLAAGAAGPPPAAPQASLVVDLRWQAAEPDHPSEAAGREAVTVSTRPAETSTMATTLRSGAPGTDETPPALPRLVLRSGETARVRLTRWREVGGPEWIWTAQGQGLVGGSRWQAQDLTLSITPRWRGGSAPVALQWALDTPLPAAAGEGAAPPSALALSGLRELPLERWVLLAETGPAAPAEAPSSTRTASRSGSEVGTWRLEARVQRR